MGPCGRCRCRPGRCVARRILVDFCTSTCPRWDWGDHAAAHGGFERAHAQHSAHAPWSVQVWKLAVEKAVSSAEEELGDMQSTGKGEEKVASEGGEGDLVML